jgi:undecaprenyl diphosphate synthase
MSKSLKLNHNIKHVAIIMDGNGRWAAKRILPVSAGHKAGAEAARKTAKACVELGIKYLTLYTFSSENWNRPQEEVKNILELLNYYLSQESNQLIEQGARIKFIGDISAFEDSIKNKCKQLEENSKNNDKITISIALNYGGRQEIVNAVNAAVSSAEKQTVETFSDLLYTANTPDPDLLIRTGGDYRISNYLLWQSAYTEFYFSKTLWPDFNKKTLVKAIKNFNKRERRFGVRNSR